MSAPASRWHPFTTASSSVSHGRCLATLPSSRGGPGAPKAGIQREQGCVSSSELAGARCSSEGGRYCTGRAPPRRRPPSDPPGRRHTDCAECLGPGNLHPPSRQETCPVPSLHRVRQLAALVVLGPTTACPPSPPGGAGGGGPRVPPEPLHASPVGFGRQNSTRGKLCEYAGLHSCLSPPPCQVGENTDATDDLAACAGQWWASSPLAPPPSLSRHPTPRSDSAARVVLLIGPVGNGVVTK